MVSLPVWLLPAFALVFIVGNIIRQLLPRRKDEPPLVFHWLPLIGNSISYGIDPPKFFAKCREKHGDIFTFVLLGKEITVYLGIDGNDFILNGKHKDLSADEIYGPLCTPVFGRGVVYDCPNSKFMEQKKFVKFGLTTRALESYVPLISQEVQDYVSENPAFHGQSGVVDLTNAVSEITILSAARSLQGEEVRKRITGDFAALYHDLDQGFRPINFVMPWAPLPRNKKRDTAHAKMNVIYTEIINTRRMSGSEVGPDMIGNLMGCTYKDGTPLPDSEIANMMITLLMAGQHTSASSVSWIIFHLASRPDVTEELYQEQVNALGRGRKDLPPLENSDLAKLPLLKSVIKETLRCHNSIHSVMRLVKNPLSVPGTDYVISPGKVLLASPAVTMLDEQYFGEAQSWNPHRWDNQVGGEEDEDDADGADQKEIGKGTRSPYLPFGAGRHRCIGEKFAYVNLGTIVASLVREFKVFTLDGKKGVPATDYASMFSCPVRPGMVRWERRHKA
ncbi:Sterol 14-alpha demethylase [Fusarium sp. DS 682]|nr:Sterol 14-alpha demethylase [Fusarium sp. DS 682]